MAERTDRHRRSDRLLDSRDFRRVARTGRRVASREFVILIAPLGPAGSEASSASCGVPPTLSSNLEDNANASIRAGRRRLGITASRKVGNSVHRNRVKRAIREWFRRNHRVLEPEVDIVVIARQAAAELSGVEIAERLTALVADAGRICEPIR